MLTTATSLILCATIADLISNNSNATGGDVASYFFNSSRCFRPSTYACCFTLLPHFFLITISDSSVPFFYFLLMFAKFWKKIYYLCAVGLVLFLLPTLQPSWIS